jgi:Mannosyltransferase (PIG-V)
MGRRCVAAENGAGLAIECSCRRVSARRFQVLPALSDSRAMVAEASRAASVRRVRRALDAPGVRTGWQALWTSRAAVFVSGVLAVLAFRRAPGTEGFDPAGLTAPFGYFGNLLVAPFARWDSTWYLAIAQGGYDHQPARTAFFPVYPLAMRGLGIVIASDLIAGVLISLVAFGIALVLLHRLAALELDEPLARVTVLLVAFCPMSYFFSAVYSESLFLALSVGCFWQARMGRWAWAGLLGGLAAAERNSGLMLLVPVVLLFLYGPRSDTSPLVRPASASRIRRLAPRYRVTPKLAWVLLIPLGLAAYMLVLALATGDGLAPFHSQQVWFRHFAGPFGGVWDGAVAAWDGLRQLVHGPPPPVYFSQAGGDALAVAGQNLMLFGFLVLGVVALVGTFRRLPLAYGAYCLAALALPLSYPVTPRPLISLPRYEVVLFPLFMWGAWWVERRRLTVPAVGTLAVLLGLFTAEFATWRFVA